MRQFRWSDPLRLQPGLAWQVSGPFLPKCCAIAARPALARSVPGAQPGDEGFSSLKLVVAQIIGRKPGRQRIRHSARGAASDPRLRGDMAVRVMAQPAINPLYRVQQRAVFTGRHSRHAAHLL